MSLQIKIVTPLRPFLDGQADEIILNAVNGQMGVLKNHAPVVTGLDFGSTKIRTKDGWKSYAIMGGFAFVNEDQVTILAYDAESAESIDPEKAKINFEIAKENLEKAEGVQEKVDTNFAYKRAKARHQVVKDMNIILGRRE